MEFFKEQLKRIQNSDDGEKKKWLIILSGISMAIIITAWIFYMNIFVFQANNPNEESGTKLESVNVEFWPVFKAGMKTIARDVSGKIGFGVSEILFRFSKIIGGQKSIEIKNSE